MTLHYQQVGTGPDIVLLHGWGGHSGVWDDVVESLKEQYRLTVFDLPGHGQSPFEPADVHLDKVAKKILEHSPKQAIWIAWSMGGLLANHIASHFPARVSYLIFVAASPKFLAEKPWPGLFEQDLNDFIRRWYKDVPETLDYFLLLQMQGLKNIKRDWRILKEKFYQNGDPDSQALLAGLNWLRTLDFREQLTKIACPTLHLFGGQDVIVPCTIAPVLKTSVPHHRFQVIEQASHMLFYTHPQAFLQQVLSFVS